MCGLLNVYLGCPVLYNFKLIDSLRIMVSAPSADMAEASRRISREHYLILLS